MSKYSVEIEVLIPCKQTIVIEAKNTLEAATKAFESQVFEDFVINTEFKNVKLSQWTSNVKKIDKKKTVAK